MSVQIQREFRTAFHQNSHMGDIRFVTVVCKYPARELEKEGKLGLKQICF